MYSLLRRLLFCLPPETAHSLALRSLHYATRLHLWRTPQLALPCKVMGLDFTNPVGIAAGVDKNGEHLVALASLGVGFVEIGSVTLQPRLGNPKPRLFRLPRQQALINRIGLANRGLHALLQQLDRNTFPGVLGINLAKDAAQQDTHAIVRDYQDALQQVYPYADYVTINLSCPHEPGLRKLQFGEALQQLLTGLKQQQAALTQQHTRYVPIAIKLSPELSDEEIAHIAQQLLEHRIDAVIATNTTNQRPLVAGLRHADEVGGLSGKPLLPAATHVVNVLHQHLQHQIPIIAVGGILCAADAQQKFAAGAQLVQVYTGLVYRGPTLIRDIVTGLQSTRQQSTRSL